MVADGAEGTRRDQREAPAELAVCALVREAVGWDRVAVVVASDVDTRAVLRGSDPVLEHFCDLQQTLLQGPSLDAYQHAAPVLVDDVRASPTPWPLLGGFSPPELPVRSLAALPLLPPPGPARHRAALGVLVAARDRVAPFSGTDTTALSHLAGVVAVLLTHRTTTGELVALDTAPGNDLAVVVGMLEEHLDADAPEALSRMRAYAFLSGCTLHEVARAVLTGRRHLDEVGGRSDG